MNLIAKSILKSQNEIKIKPIVDLNLQKILLKKDFLILEDFYQITNTGDLLLI
jgi:hypothetical protein